MMTAKGLMSAAALMVLLSGCASMNKDECLTADWQTIGFSDGLAGRSQSQIGEYRKDCADYGVTPNLEAYRAGHYEGSKSFCTAQNGFFQGRDGQKYQQSCPSDLEQTFLTGYQDGQSLYVLSEQLKDAQRQVHYAEDRIDHLVDILEEMRNNLVADGLVREERIRIRDDIDAYEAEIYELQEQLPFMLAEVDQFQQDYNRQLRRLSKYYRD